MRTNLFVLHAVLSAATKWVSFWTWLFLVGVHSWEFDSNQWAVETANQHTATINKQTIWKNGDVLSQPQRIVAGGSVTLALGASLTIRPHVDIIVDGGTLHIGYQAVDAETDASAITHLLPTDKSLGWGGIIVLKGTLKMFGVNIEHTAPAVTIHRDDSLEASLERVTLKNIPGVGVKIKGGKVNVNNCTFSQMSEDCIYVEGGAQLEVNNTKFSHCGKHAIASRSQMQSMAIHGSQFTKSGSYAIAMDWGRGTVSIVANSFTENAGVLHMQGQNNNLDLPHEGAEHLKQLTASNYHFSGNMVHDNTVTKHLFTLLSCAVWMQNNTITDNSLQSTRTQTKKDQPASQKATPKKKPGKTDKGGLKSGRYKDKGHKAEEKEVSKKQTEPDEPQSVFLIVESFVGLQSNDISNNLHFASTIAVLGWNTNSFFYAEHNAFNNPKVVGEIQCLVDQQLPVQGNWWGSSDGYIVSERVNGLNPADREAVWEPFLDEAAFLLLGSHGESEVAFDQKLYQAMQDYFYAP